MELCQRPLDPPVLSVGDQREPKGKIQQKLRDQASRASVDIIRLHSVGSRCIRSVDDDPDGHDTDHSVTDRLLRSIIVAALLRSGRPSFTFSTGLDDVRLTLISPARSLRETLSVTFLA